MAGFLFIFASTLLYVGAFLAYGWSRTWWLAVVYLGYTIANVGFLFEAWRIWK